MTLIGKLAMVVVVLCNEAEDDVEVEVECGAAALGSDLGTQRHPFFPVLMKQDEATCPSRPHL